MQLNSRYKFPTTVKTYLIPPFVLQADLALIREVAERVDEAVASFEVEHTEELVVPFGDN